MRCLVSSALTVIALALFVAFMIIGVLLADGGSWFAIPAFAAAFVPVVIINWWV